MSIRKDLCGRLRRRRKAAKVRNPYCRESEARGSGSEETAHLAAIVVKFKHSGVLRAAMNGHDSRIQKLELNRPGLGPGDEHPKMVRAEKEGATNGPVHGPRRRCKTSSNIVGNRTKGLK